MINGYLVGRKILIKLVVIEKVFIFPNIIPSLMTSYLAGRKTLLVIIIIIMNV